jgi:hypothetical protein
MFVSSAVAVTAYDMMRDDLPCVWTQRISGGAVYGMAVALRGSVLIIALHSSLLPVDIRAERPADWKVGAECDGKSETAAALDPFDIAYADGRLFVADSAAAAVRLLDVEMVPSAHATPIAEDGAPLVRLQHITDVDSTAIRELTTPFSITVSVPVSAAATAQSGAGGAHARVFVGNAGNSTIVEMTRDGVRVRAFGAGVTGAMALGLGSGWLFAVGSGDDVTAVALDDRPDRLWRAAQQLGAVSVSVVSAQQLSTEASGAVVVGQMILISHSTSDRIDIRPLLPAFV